MRRSIDDIIRKHAHICWYPSANADFRGLLYLSDRYFAWKGIPRDAGQCLPDLFIMTDVSPHEFLAYKDTDRNLGEQGYTDISLLTGSQWRSMEELYSGYRLSRWDRTRRKVTEIRVSHIEMLEDVGLEFWPEFLKDGRSERKPAGYGRAFYIRAHVFSVQREGSPEPVNYEYNCDIVYVLAENTSFARDYLLKKHISVEYVIQIRYGDSMGGGSAVPGSWVRLLLDRLNCRYFMANPRYAQTVDAEDLPAEVRDFFHGYQLKPAFCMQIAAFRDHRFCLYTHGDGFDDIYYYRVGV